MPNPRYAKGRRLEWKSRDYLKGRGYWVCRVAGSKGPADLVAIHPEAGTYLVQVKTRRPGVQELRELERVCEAYRVFGLVHVWLPRAEHPAAYLLPDALLP